MLYGISVEAGGLKLSKGHIINATVEREMNYDPRKVAAAKKQEMQQCPICKVYNDYITNVHCVSQHGMTKKEVEVKYGRIVVERERIKREMEMKRSAEQNDGI